MAESEPALASPASGDHLVYRPLSLLAIAGLVLACLFALLVLISASVALISGTPLFLSSWMLGLALGGGVLSFLAQRQIRNSEGTLAGLLPARWGFWLSLFTGLGYLAYSFFTGLALTQQANAFMLDKDVDSGFFPRLQEAGKDPAQFDAAFLLTVPVTSRPTKVQDLALLFDSSGPENSKGMLSTFRDNFMIRSIVRDGDRGRIEPLGIHSWKYEKRSYQVVRNYRITTTAAVFELLLNVQSSEGEMGSQRKWFVVFPPLSMKTQYTPVGKALLNAWKLAKQQLVKTIEELHQDKPLPDFPDRTAWNKVVAADLSWKAIKDLVKDNITKAGKKYFQVQLGKEENLDSWEIVEGRLRFTIPFNIRFKGPDNLPLMGSGQIILEGQSLKIRSEQDLADPQVFPGLSWKIVGWEFKKIGGMPRGMGPPLG